MLSKFATEYKTEFALKIMLDFNKSASDSLYNCKNLQDVEK